MQLLFNYFVLCLFCLDTVISQSCYDCVTISQCKGASQLAANKNIGQADKEKLRASFCGYGQGLPKVCCIDFHENLSLLPQDCGLIQGDRIIGGQETGLWDFPWMTLVSYFTRDGFKFQCGGTIINNRYILTAAHCIKDQNIAGIRIGEHDLRTSKDCRNTGAGKVECESRIQDVRIEEQILHPKYEGKPKVRNDIGLLRLNRDIVDARNAKPICLPVTSQLRNRDLGGANGTISGWGLTENGESSPVLLSAYVPVFPQEECTRLYTKGNTPADETLNKFCAGASGKDSCNGDSGGPLMLQGLHRGVQRLVQYGIVSYGPSLCGSNYPGVYTDVSKHMQWILDTIKP